MGCAASSASTLTVSSCQEDPSNHSSASSVRPTVETKDHISNLKTLSGNWSSETPDSSWTADIRPAGDKPGQADAIELVSLTSLERYPEPFLPQRPRHRGENATGATRQKTHGEERTTPVLSTSRPTTNVDVLASQSFPVNCRKDDQASRRNQFKRGLPSNRESSSLPFIHRRFRCAIKLLPPLRFRKVRSDETVCRAFRPLELPISRHFLGDACKQTSDAMEGRNRANVGLNGSAETWDICGYPSANLEELPEMSDFELEANGELSPPEFKLSEASSRSESIGPTRVIPRRFARVLSSDSSFGDRCADVNANEDSKYFSEDVEADQASSSTHQADTFSSPCENLLSTPSVLSLLDHVDGSTSSEDMSDISSAYPMSSDSDSSRDADISDEGFSDASCNLGAVDLSNLHIMPKFLNPKLSPGQTEHQQISTSTPILYQAENFGSDSVPKRDRGLGDNLKSSTSRPLSATSTAAGRSVSFQAHNRCSTKRSHPSVSSMVSGDHISQGDLVQSACGYSNIHLHVDFFNDFGDNFDDELDFL